MDLVGKRIVMAVAQVPFDNELNTFGTLAPLLLDDGTVAEEDDFPNNGLVWWMLQDRTRGFAHPGRLVTGTLERALGWDSGDPGKQYYQVDIHSVHPARPDDVVEIVAVDPSLAVTPRDLVNKPAVLRMDHSPTGQVFARLRGRVFGPFKAITELVAGVLDEYSVSLSTFDADHSVAELTEERFEELARSDRLRITAEASLTTRPRDRSNQTRVYSYEVLLGAGYTRLRSGRLPRVVLESDRQVIVRTAKQLLVRGRRQQLTALLTELADRMESGAASTPESQDVLSVVQATIRAIDADETQAQQIAQGLLSGDYLNSQLLEALRREFVEREVARFRAEINARTQTERAELDDLQAKRLSLEKEMEGRARREKTSLEQELTRAREEAERQIQTRRSELEIHQAELQRQQTILRDNLSAVVERFTTTRDEVVNQFLTIAPLFAALNLIPHSDGAPSKEAGREAAPPLEQPFVLPAFVRGLETPEEETALGEVEFFGRFTRHVQASGFVYRRMDLVGFHLGMKCCDLTVLGGNSGTGKSSLPRLYAEAMAGSESGSANRFRFVDVNPSWLDVRDLLGHVNALERRYEPGETGLFELLICAQEEWLARREETGIYLVCLDEMNLAHVEHYFGPFLQAFERIDEYRIIRCFSPQAVSRDTAFGAWPEIKLPRSLRFVGTVNLDETTKPLSLRLLDRVNFLRLRPQNVADLPTEGDRDRPRVAGRALKLKDMQAWSGHRRVEQQLALLTELEEPLRALGSPLNDRRTRGIRTFLGSAEPDICSPDEALDLQIAQRVLPQIRGLYRREAKGALDQIDQILTRAPGTFENSLTALGEFRQEAYESLMLPPEDAR
jgi:hypothetical protein